MKTNWNQFWLIVLFVSMFSCDQETGDSIQVDDSVATYGAEAVFEWYRLECRIIKETPGFFPPQAARALGYTGVALYESLAPGYEKPISLAGQINGLDTDMLPKLESGLKYHWGLVANACLSQINQLMFEKRITEENKTRINELEDKWEDHYSEGQNAAVINRSVSFGRSMALAIFEYSKTDGGHEQYIDPFQLPYTWPVVQGAWIPTGPAMNPLAPKWPSNRPFLTDNIREAQPLPHVAYSTDSGSEFFKEAQEVYNVVTKANSEQKEIARFWADDPFNTCTPAGHTFNILTQLLEENRSDLGMAAIAYGRLGIAENDAFIACWKTKYDYFLIRPFSYIRQNIDPNFQTIIGTPPFPAFTSGHATEAAAGAAIFADLFTNGDGNYAFTDRTQIQFGFSIRNYNNFFQMAAECADSRLFAGIHYNMDNLNGLKMGRCVGDNVNKKIRWPNN
ncbi:MAG: vanadium-dependent haloperoxidase [Saprospiraceae bacterium]|nr:vanadium-dependent haloperoxidase [Saprospiraceae bacterium]